MRRTLGRSSPCFLVGTAAFAVIAAGASGVGFIISGNAARLGSAEPLLLAPMIGVIDTCVAPTSEAPSPSQDASLRLRCTGKEGSAAALVESTLSALQPQRNTSSYTLGYTLPVPLLKLFRRSNDGQWEIDSERIGRLVRTVRDTDRPLVLYLFSTHFSSGSELERDLAKDPANLSATRDGPLAESSYYGTPIYNWNFSRTDTPLTQRRIQATTALLRAICRLPPHDLAKIKGVTLLGELHHLFPNFQGGMGFDMPYRVTDYGSVSMAGFRTYLQREFHRIDRLNHILGTNYENFEAIRPPSKDIRTETLARYAEHMDSFAQGSFPVTGWAHVPQRPNAPLAWVRVYRDGVFVGKTAVDKTRQDVLEAKPEFGNANTGWRIDMDFKRIPTGKHQIDVFLQRTPGRLEHLGTRHITIMDRYQRSPKSWPQEHLPRSTAADPAVQSSIDLPKEQSSYYYNPLVSYWHQFRQLQVVNYLKYFDGVVSTSCLGSIPHYTHQIFPQANPSWDDNKFGMESSLAGISGIRLGVSLYGEASYGASFEKWHERMGRPVYGVTEFHPLKAMTETQLQSVLQKHAEQGAAFVSFFLEPTWNDEEVKRLANPFAFDPNNTQHGSSALYGAMQAILAPHSKKPPSVTPG